MIPFVNLIGAGKLGKTIAHLFVKNGLVKLGAVLCTREETAEKAITFIGSGEIFRDPHQLTDADITFITTPDGVITEACLKWHHYFKPGSIVVHCSGSLNSEALSSAKANDCLTASIHPMSSFANPQKSISQFEGTFCALEGDREALPLLKKLFESLGAIPFILDREKKVFYHLAGVFASNYLVSLSKQAALCMKEAQIEGAMAMKIITKLMKSTLNNLEESLSPEQSLTGPIQRGDTATIKTHLYALATHPELCALYVLLAKTCVDLSKNNQTIKTSILELLNFS